LRRTSTRAISKSGNGFASSLLIPATAKLLSLAATRRRSNFMDRRRLGGCYQHNSDSPRLFLFADPQTRHGLVIETTIAQALSYIPGDGRSFWKLIGLLLLVIGFLIALSLIWVGLRWIIEKIAAAFRKK